MKEKKGDIRQAYEMQYNDRESVVAHYAEWAGKYDEDTASYGYVGPRSAAAALARHCEPGKTHVLDIGCGTGLTGVALRELGFSNVSGTDISPEMIREAERKNVYDDTSVDDLFAGLAHSDDAFDAVISVGTFGPIGPETLRECLRVIRPGGLLCVSVNELFYEDKKFADAFEAMKSERIVNELELGKHPHLLEGPHLAWIGVFQRTK